MSIFLFFRGCSVNYLRFRLITKEPCPHQSTSLLMRQLPSLPRLHCQVLSAIQFRHPIACSVRNVHHSRECQSTAAGNGFNQKHRKSNRYIPSHDRVPLRLRHRFDPVTSQLTTFHLEIMIVAALGTRLNSPKSLATLSTWLSIWLVTVPAAVVTGA
jgi:hypothetical protein